MQCRDPAVAGWLFGIAAAVVAAGAVILAIALTPPLRERDGAPAPPGVLPRLASLLALLALPLWWYGARCCAPAPGLLLIGGEALAAYAVASALAAAIPLGVVLVLLFATAGEQIARRSLR